MSVLKQKVYAYITHGDRLLIFSHLDFPEAGLQVPGGTMEEGEDPADAVMREAFEETGLTNLRLNAFLGEYNDALHESCEIQRRRFYHLICDDEPPERWQHFEMNPSDGSPAPIRFEFFWVPVSDGASTLEPWLTPMLPALRNRINLAKVRKPSQGSGIQGQQPES